MSLYGAFDSTKHFDELNSPLPKGEAALMTPAQRRAACIDNLFGGDSDPGVEFPSDVDTSNGTLTVGGTVRAAVAVTDAASYTVLAANSGKIHIVPDLTSSCTLTLPTPAAGLYYEFWYGGVAADAQNFTIKTGSDTNYYKGGVVHQDLDGDTDAPVFPDGNSNSMFTVVTPTGGTTVKMVCDGTYWYINGNIASNTVCTFADNS